MFTDTLREVASYLNAEADHLESPHTRTVFLYTSDEYVEPRIDTPVDVILRGYTELFPGSKEASEYFQGRDEGTLYRVEVSLAGRALRGPEPKQEGSENDS